MEGFKATPWVAYGQGGHTGHYFTEGGWAEGLISGGILSVPPYGWKNNFITAMWAGTTLEVTALDPIKFYADVIWGRHGMNEYKKNVRDGWFIDAAAEYTGLDFMTPQAFGFWSTGEDKSTTNGSERMPFFFPGSGRGGLHNGGTQSWNAGNSFLFDGGQELVKGSNMDGFAFLDALAGRGDPTAAWREIFDQSLAGEEMIFPFLGLLLYEARTMWRLAAGEGEAIRLPPSVRSRKEAMARRLGAAGLARVFEAAFTAEAGIKSGARRPDQAMEWLTAELFRILGGERGQQARYRS